uniref:Macrophage-expressed gene 1 protein n=1 Tax=Panagrellus redivivus TaxID=6233 RepID=A0A7E4VLN3_PANRE
MKQLRLIFSLVLLIQNSDATSSTSTTSTTPPLRLEDRVIDNSQVTKYEITSFTLCHATEKELEQGERSVNSSLLGYLGFSYDPISDESLFPVFDESFSECSKTPDGRFYIPNGYIVEDIGIMYYQKQVTLEEKYKSDSNAKSAGGSGEIKAGGVGGSGGGMVEHTKKKMAKEGNAMFRIIGYNEMYQLSGTFAAPFTRSFMRKIKRAIDFKSQGRHEAALYVIQKVIADYGTDVTISAKIGTFFEHHAFVASTEVSTTTETKLAVQGKVEAKLKNAAGNAGGAVTNSDSDTDGESEVDITFETWASGGPALKKYFGGKEVDLFDDSYPIALSRRTSSIGVMMEGGALGEEPHSVQHAMRRLFDDAANEYFERNTFEGCTNPENANFDYQVSFIKTFFCHFKCFRQMLMITRVKANIAKTKNRYQMNAI